MFIGKKTHKTHKAIIRKKKLLISKIDALKKRFEKFEVENDEMMIQKDKEKTKEEEKVKREKRNPRLVDVLPGEIVEADGSFDPLYKGKTICRIQISDSKTSDVMAINFEKQETNKSYIEAIKQMLDLGIPKIWLCDLRKGVDPSDDGAFVALLLQNLGITINANSNSNHKAVVESSNGNAHSFFAIEFAVENIRTLKEAKSRQIELKKEFNLINGRKEKIDYSHLKQLTQRQRDFIHGDMDKLKIKLSDGIYYKKKGYIAVDQNDKPIYIQRGEFVLISKLKNNKFQIWINGVIYDLKNVTDKVEMADMTFEQIFEDIKDRTFIKNNVAMMNNETLQYLIKESFKNGIKVGRNKKSWTA